MVQSASPKNKIVTHSFSELLSTHIMKIVWGAVLVRLSGHVLFLFSHWQNPVADFAGRFPLALTFTFFIALFAVFQEKLIRKNRIFISMIHVFVTLQYPIEAYVFGSGQRDVWLFMLISHGLLTLSLVYDEKKAFMSGFAVLFAFILGYTFDKNFRGFNQTFVVYCIGIIGLAALDYFAARLLRVLKIKDVKINELAAQNETGLRILSHDMANIMSVAREMLELSMEEIDENNGKMTHDSYAYLDDSRFAINQGIGMLQAVRDYLAIFSGKKDASMDTFYLIDVLKDVIQLWNRPARRKQVTIALSTRLAREATLVGGSRPIFTHSIIGNLLSNAIKFSPSKGCITLILERDPLSNCLILEVKDQGAGIPANKIPNLFDGFAKTTSAGTKGEKGTGFGLPLVKSTLDLFGGHIALAENLDSDGKTTGTRFICSIPLHLPDSGEQSAQTSTTLTVENKKAS